jgi:hypothetical protein
LFTVTDRDAICANISQIITGSPEHIKARDMLLESMAIKLEAADCKCLFA